MIRVLFPAIKDSNPRHYVSNWFPLYFRAIMIPFIGIIFRRGNEFDDVLIEHEIIHWKQFERMGFIMFIIRYILQLICLGYDTMPMEMEARQKLPDSIKWNYRKFYL